jgi:hypothetical protein
MLGLFCQFEFSTVAIKLQPTVRLGAVLEIEFLLLVIIKIKTKISNFPKNILEPILPTVADKGYKSSVFIPSASIAPNRLLGDEWRIIFRNEQTKQV